MNYYELLDTMSYLGKLMLENGAETYRVEDSIERVAMAYDVKSADVYAASTSITITIHTPDDKILTRVKRIHSRATNLDKIERLNRLCRRTCEITPALDIVKQSLFGISVRPNYSFWTQVFGYALTTSSFTLFFGGTLADSLCALLIGAIIKGVSHQLSNLKSNPFFSIIICSSVIPLLTLLFYQLGFANHIDLIMIGSIMPLVPGVALTNSIRDLMAGDFVAGQARMTEAILTATCIAIGIGIVLSTFI